MKQEWGGVRYCPNEVIAYFRREQPDKEIVTIFLEAYRSYHNPIIQDGASLRRIADDVDDYNRLGVLPAYVLAVHHREKDKR